MTGKPFDVIGIEKFLPVVGWAGIRVCCPARRFMVIPSHAMPKAA
jgi:hypothetical protein